MASSELIRRVRLTIEVHHLLRPGETVVVGVSGGPDSLCLLHVLRTLAGDYGVTLQAAHLNHSLRAEESDADARFVAELCASWQVPCTIGVADVPALARTRGLAIEEAARQARYAFLAATARQLGAYAVAVAHHADDQVETVLMHFLRGSGLAGLRGMRPQSWVDELRLGVEGETSADTAERVRLLRPLLEVTRQEIETYCREQDLRPRFDRSNLDTTYFRNRLRHELLPILETYNPNVRQVIRRTADVASADCDVLRALSERAWGEVVRSESAQAIAYDLAMLQQLPLGTQRALLREGIQRLRRSLRNISWAHIDAAIQVLNQGCVGSLATLTHGLQLSIGYDRAILAAEGFVPPDDARPRLSGEPLALAVPGAVPLPDTDWVVSAHSYPRAQLSEGWQYNPDPYVACLDAARLALPLQLRTRREGDAFSPLGLGGRHQKLRDFMINAKIPRHERAQVPLLLSAAEIVWVVGWRLDERFAVSDTTCQVVVVRCTRV